MNGKYHFIIMEYHTYMYTFVSAIVYLDIYTLFLHSCTFEISLQHHLGGTKSVTQDEKMQFICEICNKSFNKPSDHFRHIQIHDPNRPRVPCRHCSKTFTRYKSVGKHVNECIYVQLQFKSHYYVYFSTKST